MKQLTPCARINAGVLALLAFMLCGVPAHAASDAETAETRIKAAFMYHFCNYVSWPEDAFEQPDSPLVLGVVGSDAMAGTLRDTVGRRTAHGRPMEVRELDPGDSLAGVHLLFIADAVHEAARARIVARAARHVLVVTEGRDGLESGSAISFVIENDRVRFDIAPAMARSAELGISAQLLTVARVIRQEND